MYRQVVTLLLLPGLLLSQAAVFGHTHGDGTHAGHDLRPHVHTSPPPADRTHGQHHHHGDHGHHHGGHHHHDEDVAEPDFPPVPPNDSAPDHDSDAVYLSTDAATVERTTPAVELMGFVFWLVDSPALGGILASTPPVAFHSHPPPSPDPARPLYLRHLALLM